MSKGKAITLGVVLGLATLIILPALLRTFAFGMKGEFDPDTIKNRIDVRTCEFVLTPERDESFLRCPIPPNMQIPNWPNKQAPLNKPTEGVKK